jgi:enamine deaminase RidA (YjgF/YER057c/UK114 family)
VKVALTLEGLGQPVSDYSTMVSVSGGRLVFLAGQVPLDESGRTVAPGDPVEQIRQVFRNIEAALRAVGGSLDDLAKITLYLTDGRYFEAFRSVRREFLRHPFPASTGVVVAGLGRPEWLVEIEAVAVVRT